MAITQKDQEYIQQTFKLARQGEGRVAPNPMVGAVIIKGNKELSTGYHKKYGEHHAERDAILKLAKKKNIKDCAKGATIYISLEPCNHQGKTPPCTDIIIEAGIKRVVFAVRDPNHIVANNDSIKILKKAGLEVEHGILEKEARELNKVFFKNMEQRLPYFYLKTAMSLDGKIATKTGESKWITGEKSRELVHQLRYSVDAILVGVNTVLTDDPSLTVRLKGKKKNIYRIILDTNGRIYKNAQVIKKNRDKKTILVVGDHLPKKKIAELKKLKVNILPIAINQKTNRINLKALAKMLYKLSICSVLIEGGGTVNESFIKSELLDEYWCFIAPKVIGGKNAPSSVSGDGISKLKSAKGFEIKSFEQIDRDILIKANPL